MRLAQGFRLRLRTLIRKAAAWRLLVVGLCVGVAWLVLQVCGRLAAASFSKALEEAESAGMALRSALSPVCDDREALAAGGYLEAAALLAKSAWECDPEFMNRVDGAYWAPWYGHGVNADDGEVLRQFYERSEPVRLLAEKARETGNACFRVDFSAVGVTQLADERRLRSGGECLARAMACFAEHERASGGDPCKWVLSMLEVARAFRGVPDADAFTNSRCRTYLLAKAELEALLSRGKLKDDSLSQVQAGLSARRADPWAPPVVRAETALLARRIAHPREALVMLRMQHPGQVSAPWAERLSCVGKWRGAAELRDCVRAYGIATEPLLDQYQWLRETGFGLEPQMPHDLAVRLGLARPGEEGPETPPESVFAMIVRTGLQAHAVLAVSETGCAVERFRLSRGRWPADLAELVPSFLQSVPMDPIDGKPIKYARTSYGVCIYSAGATLLTSDRPALETKFPGPMNTAVAGAYTFALRTEALRVETGR